MSKMLGAPAGGSTPFGKSGFESSTVRPIFPLKGASGFGNGSPIDGVPSESLAAIAVSRSSPPAASNTATFANNSPSAQSPIGGPRQNVDASCAIEQLGKLSARAAERTL